MRTGLVTRAEVDAAAAVLAGVAVRTAVEPLDAVPGLLLKREDTQPIGAFKLRGAFHAASRLSPEVRAAGLVTHSSGNHGRALAWAAARFGVPATVVVPDDAVVAKVEAMAALGARLVRVPADEREQATDAVVAETGGALVPPYDHPDVIAGQGTVGAEIARPGARRGPRPGPGRRGRPDLRHRRGARRHRGVRGGRGARAGRRRGRVEAHRARWCAGTARRWPARRPTGCARPGWASSRGPTSPALVDDVVTVSEAAIEQAARAAARRGRPRRGERLRRDGGGAGAPGAPRVAHRRGRQRPERRPRLGGARPGRVTTGARSGSPGRRAPRSGG